MRQYILFFILIIDNSSFCQPYRFDYVDFFDYHTVLKDLNKYGKNSHFFESLDYEAMLYLDKASFKTLIKINKNFLVKWNIDTTNIIKKVPKEFIKELNHNQTDIHQSH